MAGRREQGVSVRLRISVRDPHPTTELRMQRGRDELVPPVARDDAEATFELSLAALVGEGGGVVLRGPEAQGPPDGRFVYINAGTSAGQAGSPYTRRAKVPLAGIDAALVAAAQARPGAVIACAIAGRGRDGGPAAATIPLLDGGWRLAE